MELRIDERKKIAFPRISYYSYAIRYIVEQAIGAQFI